MNITPLILCGGSGTRLWPLSRTLHPKQFMDLGGRTLFGETLERLGRLLGCGDPIVICNREHRFLVAEQMERHGLDPAGRILLEPVARNTAPAITAGALAALDLRAPGLLLVLPSDHAVRDVQAFDLALREGALCADHDMLVTFGVTPSCPETGYGYIQGGDPLEHGLAVRRFVEKPDLANAQAMLRAGGHYWNSGIFLFRPGVFLKELSRLAPAVAEHAGAAWRERCVQRDFIWLGDDFASCPATSVDYAVMEKTPRAAVVPLDAGWSDLGSWKSIHDCGRGDGQGNVSVGDVLAQDVRNCYLHSSGRLLAALGLDNLVVVETGDAVLVADRERTQEVRKIVERLGARAERETHLRVFRPWGWYETLARGAGFQVKRILVKSGAALSLQLHHRRAEHWVVVSGRGLVTVGDAEMTLSANESTYIPMGARHRLANASDCPLEIIEIQSGDYLGEDDIERFEDNYGRN